jgi:hypothetical protein
LCFVSDVLLLNFLSLIYHYGEGWVRTKISRIFTVNGSCGIQVDRNLVLCLPRLYVLATIEADRPGDWFLGSLGLYLTFFSAI